MEPNGETEGERHREGLTVLSVLGSWVMGCAARQDAWGLAWWVKSIHKGIPYTFDHVQYFMIIVGYVYIPAKAIDCEQKHRCQIRTFQAWQQHTLSIPVTKRACEPVLSYIPITNQGCQQFQSKQRSTKAKLFLRFLFYQCCTSFIHPHSTPIKAHSDC